MATTFHPVSALVYFFYNNSKMVMTDQYRGTLVSINYTNNLSALWISKILVHKVVDIAEYRSAVKVQSLLLKFLHKYKVDHLHYSTSLGVWNEAWSAGHPKPSLPPFGGFMVLSTSNPAIVEKTRWSELLRDLSSLLGSRFGSMDFSRSYPFILSDSHPYLFDGIENGRGNWGLQIAQWFSADMASADSLSRWQMLGRGNSSDTQAQEAVTREYMHDCAWYGYSLNAYNQLNVTNEETTHSHVSVDVKIHTYQEANYPTTGEVIPQDTLEIHRNLLIPYRSPFSLLSSLLPYTPHVHTIQTSVHNTDSHDSVHASVYESLPFTYTIDMSTYMCLREGVWEPLQTFANFSHNPPYTSLTKRLHGVVAYDVRIPASSTHTCRFNVTTHLMNIEFLPPDSSFGVFVPPLYVHLTNISNGPRWFVSEPLLLQAPTVDMSMPYTVFTLISTLLAFILGSFLNILARQIKH